MANKSDMAAEWPVVLFEEQQAWESWLEEHYQSAVGVRLQIAKKNSGITSVSYDDALEVALCYGWIDSRKESWDEKLWIQRFGPRGARSIWSQVNKDKVDRLLREGRMRPAGLQAVELAKQNGKWDAAYEPQSRSTVPDDLVLKFGEHPEAKLFFETLNNQNKYAILFRIQSAKKPETRAKRIEQFIEMLERGEKIYP